MTLESEWARCRPWIEAALARDPEKHTIESVERDIEDGRALLLAAPNSAMVCHVSESKSLHIFLAGGNLDELRSGDPALEDVARTLGCDHITIMGRKGWERELRDLGYRPFLAKEVSK